MPQDRKSGAAANKYGYAMAAKVARLLGMQLLSRNSNEVDLNGKRIVVKSARYKTSEIGISRAMLSRVQGIIAALEDKDGKYTLYRVNPKWYRTEMSPSRSNSPSAHEIMMVSCKDIRRVCQVVEKMAAYSIKIEWEGPFDLLTIIAKKKDGGVPPDYEGNDYGLYQIYGNHILCKADTLLYVGIAVDETFAERFKHHKKEWLNKEENIQIYIGRVYDPKKHSKTSNWSAWKKDIEIAEDILIYKYSPNYNNAGITDPPKLQHEHIQLIHCGERHKLQEIDKAPEDF